MVNGPAIFCSTAGPSFKTDMVKLKFDIGQVVYLVTDLDQLERFVVGIDIRQDGAQYILSNCTDTSYHYGFEISAQPDKLKKILTNN